MEKKDIKQFLHLYIGCECQMMGQDDPNQTFKLTGVSFDDTQNEWWAYFAGTEEMYAIIDDVFPVLRPLSSMTEEEAIEFADLLGNSDHLSRESKIGQVMEALPNILHRQTNIYGRHWISAFVWMLSKGFDLFGLIESGLAIDSTLKPV